MMDFLWFLLLGGCAGWLSGKLTRGQGFGIVRNIIIGVVGALIGGFLFRLLGFKAYTTLGSLVTATVGAIALLFVVGRISK